MSEQLTNLDIAEIWEALGDHERAAFYRWLHEITMRYRRRWFE